MPRCALILPIYIAPLPCLLSATAWMVGHCKSPLNHSMEPSHNRTLSIPLHTHLSSLLHARPVINENSVRYMYMSGVIAIYICTCQTLCHIGCVLLSSRVLPFVLYLDPALCPFLRCASCHGFCVAHLSHTGGGSQTRSKHWAANTTHGAGNITITR